MSRKTWDIEGLQAQVDVNIVPIAQEKTDALVEKYPYYASDTVPAGTYGLEEDVQTVAVLAMLAVTNTVPVLFPFLFQKT